MRTAVGDSAGNVAEARAFSVAAAGAPSVVGVCTAAGVARRCGTGASAPLGDATLATAPGGVGGDRPPALLRPPAAEATSAPAGVLPNAPVPSAPAMSGRVRTAGRREPPAPAITADTVRAPSSGVAAPEATDAAGIGAALATMAGLATAAATTSGADAISLVSGALGALAATAGATAEAACGATSGAGAGRGSHQ